jgi:hypothetical protein
VVTNFDHCAQKVRQSAEFEGFFRIFESCMVPDRWNLTAIMETAKDESQNIRYDQNKHKNHSYRSCPVHQPFCKGRRGHVAAIAY